MGQVVRDNITYILWVALIALAVVAASAALRHYANRMSDRVPALAPIVNRTQRPFSAVVIVVATRITLAALGAGGTISHWATLALIGTLVWFVVAVVNAFEGLVLARITAAYADDYVHVRKARTQITLLRRLVVAIVVLVGISVALMTFPAFQRVGQSLLASAGLVSVITGLAAQTTLSNVIAGIQLTLNNSVRIGDVVKVEGESGTVGELTLTYVVVYLWDDRRLILPSSYFTRMPFENWTRRGDEITGRVVLDLAWTVPVDEMQAEFDRVLRGSPLWDGRIGTLEVSAVTRDGFQATLSFSARNTTDMFALQAIIRKAMVQFLIAQRGST